MIRIYFTRINLARRVLTLLSLVISIFITTACAIFPNKHEQNAIYESRIKRFPASEPISLETQLESMDKSKPTVCTITINSDDEKKIFQKSLKNDFNFIELTNDDEDWFQNACEKEISCNILVVSGHFGGSFFGSSGYDLSLNTLQRKSCQTSCDGILKDPKEVFLFGCNTTAGKKADHRTPQEYTNTLMSDGFSRLQAELMSAFRYSPIGQETQDRMKQVFPNSRIYGYHRQAPSGENIRDRLNNYFNSIPNSDYKTHLDKFPTEDENLLWSEAMKNQYIRSINGSKNMENPFCILENKEARIDQKLSWINSVLKDREKSLAYIPIINDYLKDLEKKFVGSWDNFPKYGQSSMEQIQSNTDAKERVSLVLEKPILGILSVQVQVLDFAKRVGWYNEKDYSSKLNHLLGKLFKENLDNDKKDMFCSLSVDVDLSLKILPKERWNRYTIFALGCSRTSDVQVHLALVEVLKNDPDKGIRRNAAFALEKIRPTDTNIHLALVEALKDPHEYVRREAAHALEESKPTALTVLAVVELLKNPDKEIRKAAVYALGRIKPTDTNIHLVLFEVLKDTDKDVRKAAVYALEEIKPTALTVLAVVELLKNPDKDIRRAIIYVLTAIKPTNFDIHLALAETLKDPDKDVRKAAVYALEEIKPTDTNIHLALAEALKDTDKGVRRTAIYALEEIKSTGSNIHLALAEVLKDTDEDVRTDAAYALEKIKPTDPQVLNLIREILDSNAKTFSQNSKKILEGLVSEN